MAKLGKKARKFARKNLQSVLKRKRKQKSIMFKRKSTGRATSHEGAVADGLEQQASEQRAKGNSEGIYVDGAISENHFDYIFSEDDDDSIEDVSDGSFSEDPECPYISESENDNDSEDKSISGKLGPNKDILIDIAKQKRKLVRLQEKDPHFFEYLKSRRADLEKSKTEDIYSEEEGDSSDVDGDAVGESLNSHDKKVITSCTVDVWTWLVIEQPNGSALPNLLNGFSAACRYATDSHENSSQRIQNREVFAKILTFVLSEADGVFRRQLGVSESCSKERILKLTNSPEWQTVSPMVKSYLRSSLFLLNQITDSKILVFVLSRLRASTVCFAAFPSLALRFLKISVHLWATGDESLSLSSFFNIRAIASHLGSDHFDTCLTKTYKAFMAHCKFVESTNIKHIDLLANSVVELYSLDIQRSYPMVLASLQQLANMLRQALKMKTKEELKKINNWQYISCINLWVKFITCNVKDYDLRQLLFLIIQIIKGIAHVFTSPRYLPLRFKCVQMLNQLSLSSGLFVPVASLVLVCLDYEEISNANATRRKSLSFASVLKVPKQLLKSQDFQVECIHSTVKLLAAHFAQWSYHISFPELATIPLILLKNFHAKTTVESLRRPVKRLIDQIEKNSEFIQKKRDEVAFSPNDQTSLNSFLQLEKSSSRAPFTQYYASVLQNSNSSA